MPFACTSLVANYSRDIWLAKTAIALLANYLISLITSLLNRVPVASASRIFSMFCNTDHGSRRNGMYESGMKVILSVKF